GSLSCAVRRGLAGHVRARRAILAHRGAAAILAYRDCCRPMPSSWAVVGRMTNGAPLLGGASGAAGTRERGRSGTGATSVGQGVAMGVSGGLHPVGGAGLGEDVVDMALDRVVGDHERGGDRAITLAGR